MNPVDLGSIGCMRGVPGGYYVKSQLGVSTLSFDLHLLRLDMMVQY